MAARDRQREALPDRVVDELVARRAALRVDVAGGDLERRLGERERLHLRKMRREDDARTALQQIGEHADRERGALDGIRPGAGLVEDDEIAGVGVARDRAQVRRVRGERRQVTLDRLRVADVGEHGAEAREPRALRGVDEEARLREERREAERLQRDGLAARIRPGDGEAALARAEGQVDRHDVAVRELEQRVARRAQHDVGRAELGAGRAMDARELGDRRMGVDLRERRLERRERVGIRPDEVRQLDAHPALLGFFRLRGEQQAVVELDREERLDEHGLIRPRPILHDAAERPRRGGADRDDVAAVPDRDVLVGDDVGVRRIAHHRDQALLESRAKIPAGRAGGRQRRARVLSNPAGVVERPREGGAQLAEIGERVGQRRERRESIRRASQMRGDTPRHREQVAHVQQRSRLERRALRHGGAERGAERRHVRGRNAARLGVEREELRGDLEAALGLVVLGRRHERPDDVASGLRARILRDRVEHAGQLEGLEIAGPQGP